MAELDVIIVMQPSFDGEDADERRREFWTGVDDDPAGIVIVVIDGRLDSAFSTYDLAMAHAVASGIPAMLAPLRVDQPNWWSTVVE